jgi:putative oxidoreductase
MRLRDFFIGGVKSPSTLFELGLTPLRILVGLSLTFEYGTRKFPPAEMFINRVDSWGFPFPAFFAWSATLTEVVGGLLLAIGLFTRPVAFLLICSMSVVVFIAEASGSFADQLPGLLYGFIAIQLLCMGAGDWSVDRLLRSRLERRDRASLR